MDFDQILDQAIEMLQRRGRISYRALKRQFDLDDAALEDLKEELLYSQQQIIDDEGRGLVWTGALATPELPEPPGSDEEMRFQVLLPAVIGLLQGQRRVTYRTLKYVFGIDDALMAEIRKELSFRRLAIDEGGEGLVWTVETPSSVQPGAIAPSPQNTAATAAPMSPAPPSPQPRIVAADTTTDGPPASPEDAPVAPPSDEHMAAPEPERSVPEAERRQLTVMFCDLADSTKLSQELDPEDFREVIRAYQQTSAEVIQRFDGYVAQHLGDGLLIYFGWPRAHEDDAQRALHAGLGIVEAMTTNLNPRLEQDKGVQLTVRLGVHTGPVVIGQMGNDERQEHLATGETVNIAARLEGLAAPNTVVVSNVTARLVEGGFALENLGLHALKGVAEPMVVLRVLGPTELHEDETAAVSVPFLVGRDEEVGLLLRRWEQSKEGLGQVVLVSGPAGIGKSSLVEVVRAHVRDESFPRLAFRCSSYHQHSALYPVITHVERLLDVQREDTAEEKLDKLEQGLRSSSLPLDEVVPLFASLLSVPLGDRYPALTQTPEQQKQQTLDALVAWMFEEAERQPTLVVWEDLHWADPSTQELLGLVLEQTPTVPMLHVLTFRPECDVPWPTRSHMTPITLNRLERPQVEALLTHLAGGKTLPAEVVEHIVAKTDGVPLYVEELTKMFLESNLLREEANAFVLTGPLLTVAIPDTLQDSLMARLDQMHTAKEVAQLGAVLGREFDYEMLQAISSQKAQTLQAGLAQLVEAELLYQRGRPPRATYIFKHALIQDAAYASLLRGTRQHVHRQIAQQFEERFPETVETQPELVAHHYTAAGLHEQAVGLWHKAGQRASERWAYREAMHHVTKGLAVLSALPETPERLQHELDMQLTLGTTLMAIKGQAAPDVSQAFARARALCQIVGETPQLFPALGGLCGFYVVRGELQTAQELGEQLLTLAQRQHEPARLIHANQALGGILYHLGEFDPAYTHFTHGIELYHAQPGRSCAPSGDDLGVVCMAFAALPLWALGYAAQALQSSREALALAQLLGQPFNLVYARFFAALLHMLRREPHAAHHQAEATVALAAEHSLVFWEAQGTILRGWTHATQGDSDEGISQMHQGLVAYQATGAELVRPLYLALLAEGYGHIPRPEEGLTMLAEAQTVVHSTGERWWEAELHRLKGALLLSQSLDHHTEAESCFYQALEVARHQHAKSFELRATISLARLWQQDKRQDAYDLLAPVYNWFTEGFDTADLQEAKGLLDELGG